MVSELQFIAMGAFLTWCLVSSLCGMLRPEAVEQRARLLWRDHGPTGWTHWREVHYGLTTADRRTLAAPAREMDDTTYAELFDTVMHQTHLSDAVAVQFAVVHTSHDCGTPGVVFVSDVKVTGLAVAPIATAHAM